MKCIITLIFLLFINIFSSVYCQNNSNDDFENFKNFFSIKTGTTLKCNIGYMNCTESGRISTITMQSSKEIIDLATFPVFPELTYINIGPGNKGTILKFSNDFFTKTPKLETLIMNDFVIEEIPQNFIPQNSLQKIELSNSGIEVFPSQFKVFSNLKTINLQRNKIQNIPDELSEFKSLEILDLSNNIINTISENSFNGSKIKKLNLNSNNLSILPESFFTTKFEEFNLGGNNDLTAKINFSTPIKTCNIDKKFVRCYQPGSCENKDNDFKDLPVCITKTKNSTNKITKNNEKPQEQSYGLIITIILIIALFGIAGFSWIFLSNKKNNKAKEADIIISPTIKTSNYYDGMFKKDNQSNDGNNNNRNNTQSSFEQVLPESHPSYSAAINQSYSQRSQDSNSNLLRNVSRGNSLDMSQNFVIQSPILTGNDSSIVSPGNTTAVTSSLLVANTSIDMSMISPVISGNTSNLNITSPILQSTSMNSIQNPALVNNNTNNNLSNQINNNMIINNNNLLIQQNSIGFINGQQFVNNNNQIINSLPINVRTDSYNYDIKMKNNEMGGCSSSSSNNNNNNYTEYSGMSAEDIDDIKLKKKILMEQELSEKYNLINNQNNRNNDDDNNLPPYSEL